MASISDPPSISPENKPSHPDSLYRELFNLTSVITLIIDPTTLQIVEANPAACTFYGYSSTQFQSLRLVNINVLPEPSVRMIVQDVMAGTKTTFETRHRLASEQIRDVEVQANLVSAGGKNYCYAIVQDITQHKQREISLLRSERLYRLFAQNMPDSSVVMFDTDMRYTLVEGPFLKRFGTMSTSMVGKLPQEVLETQEAIDFIVSIFQRALKGESFSYERHTPDYSYEAHAAPLLDENGQIIGGMILSHDITNQKQTVDALRTSEERFRSTFDYAPIGMALFTLDGYWMDVNPAICQIMGYPYEELLQKTFKEMTHPDDLDLDFQNIQRLLAGELDLYRMEKRYFHKQGHLIWGLISVSLVRDKAGVPLYFICQLQDISEHKRLENELRASEEHLRLITDNMHDLIIQCDAQDRILYTGPSCFPLLGYKPEEMIGHFAHEFVSPDALDKIVPALQQITRQVLTYGIIEARMRHANGHYVDVETTGRFFYDSNANYTGGIFVARDITARKQMQNLLAEQQMLRTSIEKEQELSKLKTRMMERIAHEFRTPLATIQVATETVIHYYDRLTPQKREEKSVTVKNQIWQITDMLDQIGMVIRGTDTLTHLNRVPTDLCALCRAVAAELTAALTVPNKYVMDMPDKLLVSVDPHVIYESLTHIMQNAARYTEPADPVTVRIAQFGSSVEVRVIDQGIGIPANELPRIFEPFFRGSNINERGGLGIGLTIARAAVEAHGGTIRVESELRKGATFIITLPT
jgi:PAS domain S-box-containing protein